MKYIEHSVTANTSNSYIFSVPTGILPGNTTFLIRTSVVFEVISSGPPVDTIVMSLTPDRYSDRAETPGTAYIIADHPNESPARRVATLPQCQAVSAADGSLALNMHIQLFSANSMLADVRGTWVLRMEFEEYTPTVI